MFRRRLPYLFALFILSIFIQILTILMDLIILSQLFLLILFRNNTLLWFCRFLRVIALLPSRHSANLSLSCHSVWILFLLIYDLFLSLLPEIRYFLLFIFINWKKLILILVIMSIVYILWRYLLLFLFWDYFSTWKWRLVKWFWASRTLFSTTFTSTGLTFVIVWDISWWVDKKVSTRSWCS